METMEDTFPRTAFDNVQLLTTFSSDDTPTSDDDDNNDNNGCGRDDDGDNNQTNDDDDVVVSGGPIPGGTRRTLGAIHGVFAPVSLSMFSSLLFLRIGYIVGNAGIYVAFLQLILAYIILCLTVCSVSAIATNGAIEGGGVYFMISRTLGPELGGTIGFLFYCANVVGSALFATGCAEGIVTNFGPEGALFQLLPGTHWWQFLYCTIFNLINLGITLTGAGLFGKVSALILVIVTICSGEMVLSFCWYDSVTVLFNETVGPNSSYEIVNGTFDGLSSSSWPGFAKMLHDNGPSRYHQDCEDSDSAVTFSTVFAVLFSGVTGIMAGANLSGELKKPSKAIPRGTFAACAFTFVTYFILFLLTGLTCNRALLYNDCHYMSQLSLSGYFVAFGAIMTTFVASTSTLIGSSRVLQAVAKDTLLGPLSLIFTKGTTARGNPYAAVGITWFLIQLVFLMGSLNQIAKLCCVLFLMSYLSINAACFTLDWASATNFRPTFNAPWFVSLLGVVATGVMIFVVDPMYGGIGIVLACIILLIFHYVPPAEGRNWGSVAQGILFHQVRKYLLFLDIRKGHVKFWRPQVLLLVSNPRKSCNIIDFANSLKKGGLYILGHVFLGDLDEMPTDPTIGALNHWLSLIDHMRLKAFTELTVSPTLRGGIQHLMRLSGIGAMKPNTVLVGFRGRRSGSEGETDDFLSSAYASDELASKFPRLLLPEEEPTHLSARDLCDIVRDVLKLGKNVCLHRNFQRLDYSHWFPLPERCPSFMTNSRRKRRPSGDIFFDVWLVDFLSPPSSTINNKSCQFMLQLACIVSRVDKWKGAKVRVLVRVRSEVEEREVEETLRTHLAGVRIKALIKPMRIDPPPSLEIPTVIGSGRRGRRYYDLETVSDDYARFLNRRIREESSRTVVSFFQMNPPPPVGKEERFVELLEILSDDVPPCLFVHGVSPVMSTTL